MAGHSLIHGKMIFWASTNAVLKLCKYDLGHLCCHSNITKTTGDTHQTAGAVCQLWLGGTEDAREKDSKTLHDQLYK